MVLLSSSKCLACALEIVCMYPSMLSKQKAYCIKISDDCAICWLWQLHIAWTVESAALRDSILTLNNVVTSFEKLNSLTMKTQPSYFVIFCL